MALPGLTNTPPSVHSIQTVGAGPNFAAARRIAEVIAHSMRTDVKVEHRDARNEVLVAFSDHSKAERVFAQRKRISLEHGIRGMANRVKVHGARESSVFSNIEILKNLPPRWAAATTPFRRIVSLAS